MLQEADLSLLTIPAETNNGKRPEAGKKMIIRFGLSSGDKPHVIY
jgi:hypothetical protein